jgi:hypothetical protein
MLTCTAPRTPTSCSSAIRVTSMTSRRSAASGSPTSAGSTASKQHSKPLHAPARASGLRKGRGHGDRSPVAPQSRPRRPGQKGRERKEQKRTLLKKWICSLVHCSILNAVDRVFDSPSESHNDGPVHHNEVMDSVVARTRAQVLGRSDTLRTDRRI